MLPIPEWCGKDNNKGFVIPNAAEDTNHITSSPSKDKFRRGALMQDSSTHFVRSE